MAVLNSDIKENLMEYIEGKNVLLFGLGILGGGVATANWLMKNGARLTVYDAKPAVDLERSLKKIKGQCKSIFGRQLTEKDIESVDTICLNPAVSFRHPLVEYARKNGKKIVNEATLFFDRCPAPLVAVTGTRGKTTTTNWLAHFLSTGMKATIAGNSSTKPLLKILPTLKKSHGVVTEMPSYLLELFDESTRAPEVAIVTNLSSDHQNRYFDMNDYASVKANIFRFQNKSQHVIFNAQNEWTSFFEKQVGASRVWYFSMKTLSKNINGVFQRDGIVYFQRDGVRQVVLRIRHFAKQWGSHNVENLMASALGAHLRGIGWRAIARAIKTLPAIHFRQEPVFKDKKLVIINDTTATSPEGGIAAIQRFSSKSCILIAGGTDGNLDYADWARVMSKKITPLRLILLEGSATQKMLALLGTKFAKASVRSSLKDCVNLAIVLAQKQRGGTILFSPAAKSFEKFKNEFDRGEQFNKIVKRMVRIEWIKPLDKHTKSSSESLRPKK